MRRRDVLGALAAISVLPVRAAASAQTFAWYACDLAHCRRLGENVDTVLPAASVIKLLIAMTLVDQARAGRFELYRDVALHEADRVGGSDRFGTAAAGAYPAAEMIRAMLSLSDNTASNALLSVAPMSACNATARRHGFASTLIRRRFYDWAAQRRGLENTTTARESAGLLIQLASAASERGPGHDVASCAMSALLAQTDRETIPAALPRRSAVANKTGELPGVRNDVAIVGYGRPDAYAVAVMDRYGAGARSSAIAAIRRTAEIADRALHETPCGPRTVFDVRPV
jgi:beta-lactamase class A